MTRYKYLTLREWSLLLIVMAIFTINMTWATFQENGPETVEISTAVAIDNEHQIQRSVDFVVQDIKVDVTATSSQLARNQAIFVAQQQGFKKLIERIAPGFDESKLASVPEHEIEFMVQDFEIVHEKISNIRYVAVFTIRFNPAAVKQFLKKNGGQYLPNTDNLAAVQINPIPIMADNNWLIVPILKKKDRTILWQEDNSWYAQWEQNDLNKSSVLKVTVPIRDLVDLDMLPIQDAIDASTAKLDNLLIRYHMNHVAIAILDYTDENVTLQIVQYKLHGDKAVLPTMVLDVTNFAEPQILQEAVKRTLMQLSNTHQPNTSPKNALKLIISCKFSNYNQWLKIRRILELMPVTQPLIVKSLSQNQAQVQIFLDCNLQELTDKLHNHNYQIIKIKAQNYKLIKTNSMHTELLNTADDNLPLPTRHYMSQRAKPYHTPAEIR